MTTRTAPSIVTKLPGPKAKALIEKDQKYVSQPYIRLAPPLIVSREEADVAVRILDEALGSL